MKQKKLNFKQARWALTLITYDFEIFHRSKTRNSTNESSRRLDYEEISSLNIKLLSTLQNKLALSFDEKSLTQSERKNSMNSIFVFYLTNVQTSVIDERYSSSQNKREILKNLVLMFQLIEIQIVISRKKMRDIFEIAYEKSQKSMKSLIKKLQIKNI